jgi:hypothetical protein
MTLRTSGERDEKWNLSPSERPYWPAGSRPLWWCAQVGEEVTTHCRFAACTKGHRIEVSFSWEQDTTEGPKDYSKPCPTPGCDGLVVGKLPIGTDFSTLELTVMR